MELPDTKRDGGPSCQEDDRVHVGNRQDGTIISRPDRGLVVEVGDGVIVVLRPGEAGTIDSLFRHR